VGSDTTNIHPRVHWQPDSIDLKDWRMRVHHGDNGITAEFPLQTGATMWNDLRTKAAISQAAFDTFMDNATGDFGDVWDTDMDSTTKESMWKFFRDIAPPG
jgi:hypothetical protein